jgi:hypothetical protein
MHRERKQALGMNYQDCLCRLRISNLSFVEEILQKVYPTITIELLQDGSDQSMLFMMKPVKASKSSRGNSSSTSKQEFYDNNGCSHAIILQYLVPLSLLNEQTTFLSLPTLHEFHQLMMIIQTVFFH